MHIFSCEDAGEWTEVLLSGDSEQVDQDGSSILEALYEQYAASDQHGQTVAPGDQAPEDELEPLEDEEELLEDEEERPEDEEAQPEDEERNLARTKTKSRRARRSSLAAAARGAGQRRSDAPSGAVSYSASTLAARRHLGRHERLSVHRLGRCAETFGGYHEEATAAFAATVRG